jgi:hypothetical protein
MAICGSASKNPDIASLVRELQASKSTAISLVERRENPHCHRRRYRSIRLDPFSYFGRILDAALHSRFLQSLALPGHIAIISIWGAHGMDSRSETIALIAGMSINAIVYSLIAFGLLKWFGHSIESRSPRDG